MYPITNHWSPASFGWIFRGCIRLFQIVQSCLWTKSCTTFRMMTYPITHKVFNHPRWLALGFLNHQQAQCFSPPKALRHVACAWNSNWLMDGARRKPLLGVMRVASGFLLGGSRVDRRWRYGCFLKWWYPQNTPKWSFLVGKPMVVGYHHLRKPPYIA